MPSLICGGQGVFQGQTPSLVFVLGATKMHCHWGYSSRCVCVLNAQVAPCQGIATATPGGCRLVRRSSMSFLRVVFCCSMTSSEPTALILNLIALSPLGPTRAPTPTRARSRSEDARVACVARGAARAVALGRLVSGHGASANRVARGWLASTPYCAVPIDIQGAAVCNVLSSDW